jgi:hypothetical protein
MNLLALLVLADPTITTDPGQLTAPIGTTLSVETVVHDSGPGIAHLNVVSLDGVYVDLEDWTQDVTQRVAGGPETSLDWEFQAVNPGRFAVYVVLIPQHGRLIAGPPVYVTVSRRQTLDTGGALPVAIAVPGLLGGAILTRRLRTPKGPEGEP